MVTRPANHRELSVLFEKDLICLFPRPVSAFFPSSLVCSLVAFSVQAAGTTTDLVSGTVSAAQQTTISIDSNRLTQQDGLKSGHVSL